MNSDLRNIVLKSFFILVFAIISFSVFCQLDTIHLKEVEIREQFPIFPAINKSSSDSIRMMKSVSANVGEVISFEPGIMVKRYGDGGLTTVSFHGADPSHTKVEWNDMPINSSMNGLVDFSLIPACPTDRISLLYGANSLAYQSGALGGVVRLHSAAMRNLSQGFEIKQEVGSFGLINSYAGIVLGKKNIKSFSRLSYHKSLNDFSYENSAILPKEKMVQKDAGFDRINFIEELFFSKKNHDFAVRYWQSHAYRNIPALMTNIESAEHNETQSDQTIRALAEWNFHHDCFRTFVKQGFSYGTLQYKMEHFAGNNTVTFINSESLEKTYFAKAGSRYCISEVFQVNATLDYTLQKADIFEERAGEGYDVNSQIIETMLDLESCLKPWLNFTSMIRVKNQQNAQAVFIPGAFLSVRPFKSLIIKTAISQNVNFPTLNDLYYMPGGNPELKPEKGLQSDASIIFKSNSGFFKTFESEVNFFYSDINQWILWQPTQFGYWTPVNVREVVSKGVQSKISFVTNFGKSKCTWSGVYTLNQATAKDKEYVTTQLPYLPIHSGNAAVRFSSPWFDFFAEEIFSGTINTSYYGSYSHDLQPTFITNLSILKSLKYKKLLLSVEFRMNNVFDESYQLILWRPMPGRNSSVVITCKI